MFFWLIALLTISLWGCKRSHEDEFLSRERTISVNAIFVLYIFLSHSRGFVGVRSLCRIDPYASVLMSNFGQLCVVSFLLFSGYGLTERILAVGKDYVRGIPTKRILPFYINSLPIAFAWIVMGLFISSVHYPIAAIGQLTFWKAILYGPCWYNFVIIAMYGVAFISFRMFLKSGVTSELVTWGMSFAVLYILAQLKADEYWWYDTLMAFPFGVTVSLHKKSVVRILKRFSIAIILGVGVCCYFMGVKSILPIAVWGNIRALLFSCGLLAVMYQFSFGNSILMWIGKRVFQFYMTHALFLFIFGRLIKTGGGHVAMICSLALTLVIVKLYPMFPYYKDK